MDWYSLAVCILPIAFFWCCCGALPCDYCDASPPDTMQVTISGLTNNICADCATLDGTYDCERDPGSPADNCYWHYYFPGGCLATSCEAAMVSVFVNNSDSYGAAAPGAVVVRLRFFCVLTLDQDIFWEVTQPIVSGSNIIDCNFSSLDVPFSHNQNYNVAKCDGSAATCTVTAL